MTAHKPEFRVDLLLLGYNVLNIFGRLTQALRLLYMVAKVHDLHSSDTSIIRYMSVCRMMRMYGDTTHLIVKPCQCRRRLTTRSAPAWHSWMKRFKLTRRSAHRAATAHSVTAGKTCEAVSSIEFATSG